jgi:DNA-binding NtrC family response regulator
MSGCSSDIMTHHGVLEKEITFIQKPFTMEQFSHLIRQALESTQAPRNNAGRGLLGHFAQSSFSISRGSWLNILEMFFECR